MKVFMLGGYGDIPAETYVEYADEDDAARLISLKAARPLDDDEAKANPPIIFTKVPAAKAASK